MGKRRHQSSSVEEISPAVIKRTSSRLTRSKKHKTTSKSASPVLGKALVNRAQDVATAGSSNTNRTRITPRQLTRRHISDVQRLLELDCQTPVRSRHGRSNNVQFNSPYSESEPEIIWDDKSPNAVQPRKLGKAGKRNAVEDISDIINCVPDIIDNTNKTPSLLSLWMTRDSPSPKATLKSSQESSRPETKKGVGKKKARKSRLSALTHELEKVLSAIEPDEEDVEEEEEEETAPDVKPHCSKATTAASSTTTSVEARVTPPTLNPQPSTLKPRSAKGRSSPPTLYTQTKPGLPKPIPLPALGHSPGPDDSSKGKDNAVIQKLDKPPPIKEVADKETTSDVSPPGSQTKWEAIGNESAEDLWGDDDMFDDDGILMETIEVEIASSQVTSSTPIRRVRKRLSLKKSGGGDGVKVTDTVKPISSGQELGPISKAKLVPVEAAKQSKTFVRATSSTTIPKQTGTSCAPNTAIANKPVQASQKTFVPKANHKSGFQPFKPSTSSVGSVSSQTTSASKTYVSGSASYSLRSTNNMPLTSGGSESILHKYPTSKPSSDSMNNCKKTSTHSAAGVTSVTNAPSVTRTSPPSVTRTSPPSVTRVTYSTSTTRVITNPSVTTRSHVSKFVPFTAESQSAKYQAPTTTSSNSSVVQSKPVNSASTANQNSGPSTVSVTSNKPSASKSYVPYQKTEALKKSQNVLHQDSPHTTKGDGSSQQSQSKVYVPFGKQTCQSTTSTTAQMTKTQAGGKSQTTCTPSLNTSKAYVPYKKANQTLPSTTTQTHCGGQSRSGFVSSQNKHDTIVKTTGQAVTSISSKQPNVSSVNSTSVKSSTTTLSETLKPRAHQGSISSQIGDSKSRNFVPFKKPQSTQSNQFKPSVSSLSSGYTPAIPSRSSQYKPTISNSSSQYTPAIPSSQDTNKSVVFGSTNSKLAKSQTGCTTKLSSVAAMTNSKTFARHTGTVSNVSQPVSTSCNTQTMSKTSTSVPATKPHTFVRVNSAQASIPKTFQPKNSSAMNKANSSSMQSKGSLNPAPNRLCTTRTNVQLGATRNLAASKCSNNNVDLNKMFSPSKQPSKSAGSLSSTRTNVTKDNITMQRRSFGAGPDSKSSVVESGQFDDSLPDEMLMSVMDGSWDEF